MPKVSVIMPAYNAEQYIGESIDSILKQTFTDFELIILNDCSRDSTEEIILSYRDSRIVYLKNEENMGVAGTLNRGLAAATGEYVARMDADDISLPERLEKQVNFLDRNSKVAVLGTCLERFGEEISTQYRSFSDNAEQMKIDLLFSCGLAHPSVMMRRAVIAELGGYDLEYEGLEDYELWCRVAEQHDVLALPDLLLRYRVHGKQVTKNPSEKYLTRMRRLKERQLHEIGIPTHGEVAESFYRYCLGNKPDTVEEAVSLAQFLEDVCKADHPYDVGRLKATFRAVLLGTTYDLSWLEVRRICKSTELICTRDVLGQRAKRVVRRLLGKS